MDTMSRIGLKRSLMGPFYFPGIDIFSNSITL
ncbi:hypothetical protein HRM2_31480 [Desulforapulum autotrophicum HRM2]|uniref:Uncharacterized protein n=1 Tax=Desulforapulum autotrophicum (strain ATCC 43914 / DSM 3382 / VKM B-1955 / HRM2) TaxID=177437 RepID=C0QKZ1_DESAH|nr:hypothetical protein HRM2_31480 [Desulforapulum autotrophicum HRM2]